MSDVEKWKKGLSKKGPFFLLRVEPWERSLTMSDGTPRHQSGNIYVVIWNDKEETKIGGLSDHMTTRYGIGTRAKLFGERPQDMWNGHKVDDKEFEAMRAVRSGETNLREFRLDELSGLTP